jgi:phosphatidylserine/phosphatidylglycerophosphate/cardiolipin synthase-like enzyme
MDGVKGSQSVVVVPVPEPEVTPPAKAAVPSSSSVVTAAPPVRSPLAVSRSVVSTWPRTPAAPVPRSLDEAFDGLVASASGPALVRRHTDNVMAWNMKWALVTRAQRSFDFSYFSIERDAYGLAYLGALLDARLRGVEVNGVTDYLANARGHGFASTGLGNDYLQELASAGARIGLYDTLGTRAKSVVEEGLTYKALSSDHDKLAVADAGTPSAEGETGGRNVARAYHQDPRDNPASWRDDSLQIKGAVTSGLVTALRRELDGPAVTLVKPDLINVESRATELLGAYALMKTWLQSRPLSEVEKAAVRADPTKRAALADQLYADGLAALRALPEAPDKVKHHALSEPEQRSLARCATELTQDLELKGSQAAYDALGGYLPAEVKILDQVGAASAPGGQRYNEMAPDLLRLIQGAQHEVLIQNPYVVLTEPMLQALEDAARRGVTLTIVTNSPASTDSAITQGFLLNDWKLLEQRVPTARLFVATGARKFHAKAFVLDGKVSGDTSYNADLLSGLVNGEVGAVSRSEANAQELLSRIYEDLADPANHFKEWTLQRDANGVPVKGPDGELVAAEGPEQDISARLRRRYGPVRLLCEALTHTALGAPLKL